MKNRELARMEKGLHGKKLLEAVKTILVSEMYYSMAKALEAKSLGRTMATFKKWDKQRLQIFNILETMRSQR